MASKIRLVIASNEYYVNTDDSEEYIRALGDEIEKSIEKFSRNNPCLSTTQAAVLCALEYCDKCHKNNDEIARLNGEVKNAVADLASSSIEASEAVKEIEYLSAENLRLRELVSEK